MSDHGLWMLRGIIIGFVFIRVLVGSIQGYDRPLIAVSVVLDYGIVITGLPLMVAYGWVNFALYLVFFAVPVVGFRLYQFGLTPFVIIVRRGRQ